MDLTFVQTSNMFGRDGAWETEFSVDQEFNLHLERESSGKIIMMQKTAGTFFDIVKDFDMKSGDVVYDYDSASFLGTKTIKIVSESAIRFASLTTSGEVTEIKSQSKEIEVTSNGTTEVTPDAGFAYLNSVKVKTNVPTSGGGVGYLYFENIPLNAIIEVLMFSSLINNGTQIIPSFLCGFNSEGEEENITVRKIAAPYGYTWNDMKITEDFLREFMSVGDITEITEEEFYNLNA